MEVVRPVVPPANMSMQEIALHNLRFGSEANELEIICKAAIGWFKAFPEKRNEDLDAWLKQEKSNYRLVAIAPNIGPDDRVFLPWEHKTEAELMLILSHESKYQENLGQFTEDENTTRLATAGFAAHKDYDPLEVVQKEKSVEHNTAILKSHVITQTELQQTLELHLSYAKRDGVKVKFAPVHEFEDGRKVTGIQHSDTHNFVSNIAMIHDNSGTRLKLAVLDIPETWQ
jgi:hypothetical protein